MINGFHLLLSLLGISFLIFIHELGHYFVARRVGMTVEVFSIGFGKPIHTWLRNGVKWQVCWLLFGGYVRIAGMEKQGSLEPYQIADGFYGKKPWDRIKVAFMGPLVNILFAFLAFVVIWMTGGQEKPFQQYTGIIGEIESQSPLYPLGVQPGDQITSINDRKEKGFKEIFFDIVTSEKPPSLNGLQIDYYTGDKNPFSYTMPARGIDAALNLGIAPASYLIFDTFSSPASPLKESGIQKGDRILWVDGELVFSREHLLSVINEQKTLLTVRRGDKIILSRVPRLKISDLRLDPAQKAEFDDWQHEADLKTKAAGLFFIPYNLSHDAVVANCTSYIDQNAEEQCHVGSKRDPFDVPLQAGDKIIAVEGSPVSSSIDLLAKMQSKNAILIVQRQKNVPISPWSAADQTFEASFNGAGINQLTSQIGSGNTPPELGDLVLLPPIALKSFSDLPLDETTRKQANLIYEAEKRAIEKIEDPEMRDKQLRELEERQKRWMLGALLSDRKVSYNPNPVALFGDVFSQTWRSFLSLISGIISPKYMGGPIGIVNVIQQSWSIGFKEALFWLGFVSLNLAFINLLPIPVVDGGHILFAIIESITKKPIKAKTMERVTLPFIILIVAFFIYVTYHDLARLLGQFF